MAGWDHGGGFSVDASVAIAADDRPTLERLAELLRPALLGGGATDDEQTTSA